MHKLKLVLFSAALAAALPAHANLLVEEIVANDRYGIGATLTDWSPLEGTELQHRVAGIPSPGKPAFDAIGDRDTARSARDGASSVGLVAIPEPLTISLVFFAAAAVLGLARRRKPAKTDA